MRLCFWLIALGLALLIGGMLGSLLADSEAGTRLTVTLIVVCVLMGSTISLLRRKDG